MHALSSYRKYNVAPPRWCWNGDGFAKKNSALRSDTARNKNLPFYMCCTHTEHQFYNHTAAPALRNVAIPLRLEKFTLLIWPPRRARYIIRKTASTERTD